jgi:hypothetical protein
MLEVHVDVGDIRKLNRFVDTLTEKNLRFATARAMTRSAQAAQQQLKQDMGRYIRWRGGPTPFTTNSTYVRFANPGNLTAEVGFKSFGAKNPAGRYLQSMARGGPRQPKGTERRLRDTGVIRSTEWIVPTGVTPLRLNAYGNLSGATYQQLISRLKGYGEGQGFTANASGSTRSNRKRSDRDYFVGMPGGLQRGIYARLGKLPKGRKPGEVGRPITSNLRRGYHTVFYLTRAPIYRSTFPISDILNQSYQRAWKVEIQRAVAEELATRSGGIRL